MPTTINALPYELLAAILEEATKLNLREIPSYTYGLSQAPEPMRRDVRMQRVVRGPVGLDELRWNATDAIRRVNRTWHDWACRYALSTLYISRWRGSERYGKKSRFRKTKTKSIFTLELTNEKKKKTRWLESRILTNLHAEPSGTAVYQDPYSSLRKTVGLFSHGASSALASCVRRIWLNGYYGAETTALMFELLLQLPSLEYLTLPWMALRNGTAEQWSRLLTTTTKTHLSSLEFLAVNLKASQIEPVNQRTVIPPLNSPGVDFRHLTRLKIIGDTNHLGLTDEDLVHMSRTATNLHEIHTTGTSSSKGVSIEGVMALAYASRESLRVLEYTPIHPSSSPPHTHFHPCAQIQQCRQLRNLTITLPSICTDLFHPPANPAIPNWTGEVQIRTTSLCPSSPSPSSWEDVLHRARNLIQTQVSLGINLSIEIYFRKLQPRQIPFNPPPLSPFSLIP